MLNEKSKSRYKNWPNTLEAIRKKKDDDRIRKLEDQEIEKRKIGKSAIYYSALSSSFGL